MPMPFKSCEPAPTEIVLHWRPLHGQYRSTNSRVLVALMWLVSLATTALLIAMVQVLPATARSGLLDEIWSKAISIEGAVIVLGLALQVCFHFWSKRSRLIVSRAALRHESGLPPWLAALFRQNWTLPLDQVRMGVTVWSLSGMALGPFAPRSYVLSWGPPLSKTYLRLSAWFGEHDPPREPLQTNGSAWTLGDHWRTPQARAQLQHALDELPLVCALRQFRISLPSMAGARNVNDMTAFPRIRTALAVWFALLICAGLGLHFYRRMHFFADPPAMAWMTVGALTAGVAWMWLRSERDAAGEPVGQRLPLERAVVAGLVGLTAAIAAPTLLMAANTASFVAQPVTVHREKHGVSLVANDRSVPAFTPSSAVDFWLSMPPTRGLPLVVRAGFFGTWQYDTTPIDEQMRAFYFN